MKIDNQALRLEHLMKLHRCSPLYELCFPSFRVKKRALEKLALGDVLLLGLDRMEMCLLSKEHGDLNVLLSFHKKKIYIQILSPLEKSIAREKHKKYRDIKLSLGRVEAQMLKRGQTIETEEIDLDNIVLSAEEKIVARGRVVEVDNEIAIEIREVM